MATDLERLVVQLSADIKGYENALNRAQGVTTKRFSAIQKRAETSNKAIAASFIKTGAQIGAAFLASSAIREAAQLSDAATRVDNALKVAGLSGAELEKVYQRLSKAALDNGAPIETLATLYGRAAQSQKELGATSEELLGFTSNVALALRVAGTDATAAQGALLQLGQALGSGTVHAEEFNSVLEGAPTIAQAAAAGLKEAGGSVAQLKSLVVDGKVSSEAFFRAFEAGAPMLEQKAASSVTTLDQATTNLKTALIDVVREFNNSTGASENFAVGINGAARAIANFDVSGLIDKIRSAKEEFEGFLGSLGNSDVFASLNQALGVSDGQGNIINLDASDAKDEASSLEKDVKLLQDRIALNTSLGFDNTEAIARIAEVQQALASVRAAAANMPATIPSINVTPGGVANINAPEFSGKNKDDLLSNQPAVVKPVSIADYKPVKSSSGGGRKRGGGGKGENDYQRETQQIKERTAAVEAETAAQAGVNPLINDYGFALEKARAESDLLTAAQRAGLAVTPELKASIEQLATGYATASAAAEKLQDSQDQVRQAADDFKSTTKDITGGFISDLRSGSSAAEALSNALNKVLDKLIDIGLNSVFGTGPGGGSGLLGGLFSLFGFAKGGIASRGKPIKTFARGGVSKSAAIFGEAGPEAAVPLPDGRSIPVKFQTPSIPKRAGVAQQGVSVQVGVTVDDDGKLQAYVKNTSQQQITAAAPRIVSAANQQVVPTMAKYQANKAGGEWR